MENIKNSLPAYFLRCNIILFTIYALLSKNILHIHLLHEVYKYLIFQIIIPDPLNIILSFTITYFYYKRLKLI